MNAITVSVTDEQMELLNFLKEKGISKSFIIRKALQAYLQRLLHERKNVRKKAFQNLDFNQI